MKIDKEKKIEEFNFQSEITKRLEERKTQQKDVEKEIQQAQQVIQQKVAESNALMGAISELEDIINCAIKTE